MQQCPNLQEVADRANLIKTNPKIGEKLVLSVTGFLQLRGQQI